MCRLVILRSVVSLVVLALACNLPAQLIAASSSSPTIPEPGESPSLAVSASETEESLGPAPSPGQTPEATSAIALSDLRIAYTSGGRLWTLDLGSSPKQITDSGFVTLVRLSDDGDLVVYLSRDQDENTEELRTVSFDGHDDRLLVDAAALDRLYPLEGFPHYEILQLEFLPGTHTVLFNTHRVTRSPETVKNDDLLLLDVDTGSLTTLLDRGQGGDFTISPDGSQIAIARSDSVSLINSDGTDPRLEVLTFPPVEHGSEFSFYPQPVWLPDGSSVIVSIPQKDHDYFYSEPETGTVWEVPISGREPQVLMRVNGDLFSAQLRSPNVSPDGSTVAYMRGQWFNHDLLFTRINSGEVILYDSDTLPGVIWSPNSIYFVYAKSSGEEVGPEDYLGEIGRLGTRIESGNWMSWIDDERYLYLAEKDGNATLSLGSVNKDPVPLAVIEGAAFRYDFSR